MATQSLIFLTFGLTGIQEKLFLLVFPVPLIEKSGPAISPPPNASIEVGPGGSMVPMLRPRTAISSSVGTGAVSTSSSETGAAGGTTQTTGGGPIEYESEIPTLGETVDGIICGICCKTYKNRTCLKQHYNNVHLRLQHYCWIKGIRWLKKSTIL